MKHSYLQYKIHKQNKPIFGDDTFESIKQHKYSKRTTLFNHPEFEFLLEADRITKSVPVFSFVKLISSKTGQNTKK